VNNCQLKQTRQLALQRSIHLRPHKGGMGQIEPAHATRAVRYNPKKPGRPSHVHHTYMLAGLRLVLGVETAPGKCPIAHMLPTCSNPKAKSFTPSRVTKL
jgi:hypothetical protein